MSNNENYHDIIFKAFPKLKGDKNFSITSPATPDYNCIAWAALHTDAWWAPGKFPARLDGVTQFWPPDIPEAIKLKNLELLFKNKKYKWRADDDSFEKGFLKVALYVISDESNMSTPLLERKWTHAARQLSNGLWTSKLGENVDIKHSNPYTIENEIYGKVGIILKRKYP